MQNKIELSCAAVTLEDLGFPISDGVLPNMAGVMNNSVLIPVTATAFVKGALNLIIQLFLHVVCGRGPAVACYGLSGLRTG